MRQRGLPAWRVCALNLLSVVLVGCPSGQYEKLRLSGSSTVAPLLMEIGKRFEQENPGIRVDVQSGGSTRGVNDTLNGLVDIGMASRALKPSETGLLTYTVARDGIAILLHKDNPIAALSRTQIVDIYTGRTKNWQAFGGPDQPIVVINKAEGRSTLELFLDYYHLSSTDIKPHIVIGDNQQALKIVAGNPWAIAYVSIGAAAYEAGHGAPLKLLAVDGVAANLENVASGRFPITRPLNLLSLAERNAERSVDNNTDKNSTATPAALSQRFIQYAQSAAVADLVQQQYFVAANASLK